MVDQTVDAETINRRQHLPFLPVPQDYRKATAEFLDESIAKALI